MQTLYICTTTAAQFSVGRAVRKLVGTNPGETEMIRSSSMRHLLIAVAAATVLLLLSGRRCAADKIYFKNLIRRDTPVTVWCEGIRGDPIPQLWNGSPVTSIVLGYGEAVFLYMPPTVHIIGSVGSAAPRATPEAMPPAAMPPAANKKTSGPQCYGFFRWNLEQFTFPAYSSARDRARCQLSCAIEARWDGLYGRKNSISSRPDWEFIQHYPIHPFNH